MTLEMDIDKEYYELKNELTKIKEKYENEYENMEMEVKRKCVKHSYSRGGLMLHRGFYCPSPIIEKICGNVNRGRIVCNPTKSHYKYYFDNEEKLICVEKKERDIKPAKEFLIYQDNVVFSVAFDCTGTVIHLVTKCVYNNLLANYSMLIPCYDENDDYSQLEIEKYYYSGEKIDKAIHMYCLFKEKVCYCNEYKL